MHNNEKAVSIVTIAESYSVKSRNGNQFWRVDLFVEGTYHIVITAWNTLTMQMNTPKHSNWSALVCSAYIQIYISRVIYMCCMFITLRVHGRFYGLDFKKDVEKPGSKCGLFD